MSLVVRGEERWWRYGSLGDGFEGGGDGIGVGRVDILGLDS